MLGQQLVDLRGVVRPGEFDFFVQDGQARRWRGFDFPDRLQHAQSQHVAQRFGAARQADILVQHRVDVATAALNEQGHRPLGQIVFNHLRGEPGQVGCVAAIWHPHDRMARKVVNDRQIPAILPVESQDADLRVDRPDAGHLGIRRQGVGVPHVGFLAVFELQPAILGDAIFGPDPRANAHRRQIAICPGDRLDRPDIDIGTNHAMTMAGIDDDTLGRDLQVSLKGGPDLAQVIVANVADAADGHGIHRDDHGRALVVPQDERLDVQRIVDRQRGRMRDIDPRHPGPQTPRLRRRLDCLHR